MNNNDLNKQNNSNLAKTDGALPTDVQITEVKHEDTMLNRERDNIISATIQANEAIDEKQARDVNNQIANQKIKPLKLGIIVFAIFLLASIIAFFGYKLVKKIMTYDDPLPTSTTSSTRPINKIMTYLEKDHVRKFESNQEYTFNDITYDKFILMLAPPNIDLKENNNYYLLIMGNEQGLNTESGTYTIENNVITVGNFSFNINDDHLYLESYDLKLKIQDAEMKYYKYSDSLNSLTLIINGTPKYEYALFIDSNVNRTTLYSSSFVEDKERIVLDNDHSFTKSEVGVNYSGKEMSIGQ